MKNQPTSAGGLGTAVPLELDEVTTKRRLADNRPTTFAGKAKERIYYMRGRGALEIGIIFVVIIVAFSIVSLIWPNGFAFLSSRNLSGVITQDVPDLALLSIAAGILMIAGEFDLSLGPALALVAIIFIRVTNSHGWVLGAVAAIASGIFIALVNAIIVVQTRIPSFIATLGMAFFWGGAAIFVNGTIPAVLDPAAQTTLYTNLFAGDWGYFRSQIIWMVLIGIAGWLFLQRHRRGNHIYAVGGNANAAKAISINPKRVKLMAWGVFGLIIGFAAVMLVAQTSGMQPGAEDPQTLYAIAGAVVGGCSLTGGRGTVLGMIIGAALIRIVENGLLLAKAPGFYIQLFVGVTIVIAAVFNKMMEGKAT
jgi:simple sugar transport system permease protein